MILIFSIYFYRGLLYRHVEHRNSIEFMQLRTLLNLELAIVMAQILGGIIFMLTYQCCKPALQIYRDTHVEDNPENDFFRWSIRRITLYRVSTHCCGKRKRKKSEPNIFERYMDYIDLASLRQTPGIAALVMVTQIKDDINIVGDDEA